MQAPAQHCPCMQALSPSSAPLHKAQPHQCDSAAATAAADSKIGEFAASGFVFKDTVEVRALDDPEGASALQWPDEGLQTAGCFY